MSPALILFWGRGCLRRDTFCQQRQKVCKKRRQKPDGFWTSFARSAHFRPLGCVPHVWKVLQGNLNIESSLRRTADDPTFRPRPTENPLADRKGFQNLGFGALLGAFPAREKYPVGDMDQPIQPPLPRQTQKQTGEGFSGLPYITTYSPPSPQTRGNPSPAPLCRRREPPSP